jgi:hypothetical protein
MDPIRLSASAAGFFSLAIQLTKIIGGYVTNVQSAPAEARELTTEVKALSHVLETVVDVLRSEDIESTSFEEQSVLFSVIGACRVHLNTLYKKLSKLCGPESKATEIPARFMWPFQKDDCQQYTQTLHRYTQTLHVLLAKSNR